MSEGDMAQTDLVQPSGEVVFRRDNDGLYVDSATPVMWFARHALRMIQENPDEGWVFDGTHVTLDVTNGRWVWKLTGRTWCHSYGPEAEPLVMCEGVWPD